MGKTSVFVSYKGYTLNFIPCSHALLETILITNTFISFVTYEFTSIQIFVFSFTILIYKKV